MTPNLRKKHRLTWTAFSILLPLLLIAAIWIIPKPVYQDAWPTPIEEAPVEKKLSNDQAPSQK